MTVRCGSAMPRDVFHHGQDTAIHKPFNNRPPERGDTQWVGAERTVPDRVRRTGRQDIQDWNAIDVDANIAEIGGYQPAMQPGGAQACLIVGPMQLAEQLCGTVRRPVWRLQAPNASAFLVDEDGSFRVANCIPKRCNEIAQRIRLATIALEQDETPGTLTGKEGSFVAAKPCSSTAGYEGLGSGHVAPPPFNQALLSVAPGYNRRRRS